MTIPSWASSAEVATRASQYCQRARGGSCDEQPVDVIHKHGLFCLQASCVGEHHLPDSCAFVLDCAHQQRRSVADQVASTALSKIHKADEVCAKVKGFIGKDTPNAF